MEATHKLVDGLPVELTEQERAEIEADWALNRKPPAPPAAGPVIADLVKFLASERGMTLEQFTALITNNEPK